jgi:hypothetical protein
MMKPILPPIGSVGGINVMSTAPFPGAYPFTVSDVAAQHLAAAVSEAPELPVRRRANVEQARAIQKLGHAMDHLIYSRMFLTDAMTVKAEGEAIHILMTLRREVFQECERIVSEEHQVKRWLMERLTRTTH